MKQIELNERDDNMNELEKAQAEVKTLKEQIQALNLKLSEAPAATELAKVQASVTELTKKVGELETENAGLKAKTQTAEEAVKLAEQNADFDKQLSEGKVCEAQRKPFLANNMTEFLALAEKVNLKPGGTSGSADPADQVTEDKIIQLAESKYKADPKTSYGDHMSAARKELLKK